MAKKITLPRRPIELVLLENTFRSRGKCWIWRQVREAHPILDTRLWGQDVQQWTGKATVYGQEIQVWGWALVGYIPRTWGDYPE